MGASIEYGVGGAHGGWADLVKLHLHQEMYAGAASNESHEVHIFAKPDATVQFVIETHARYIADYKRDGRDTIVVLSVGMNDTKAIAEPANYLSTPEKYKAAMTELIGALTALTTAVVCVGFTPVDETKTFPKLNPFTGKYSYFSNERIQQFNAAFEEAANSQSHKATFINVADQVGDKWTSECLSGDGLHPNDKGHQRIFAVVMPELDRLLS